MQVGKTHLRDLPATRTLAARVAVGAVLAVDILRVRDGQRKRTVAFTSQKHLRMADTVLIDRTNQMPLDIVLPYDICKSHTNKETTENRIIKMF